jgi:hypothetical protein
MEGLSEKNVLKFSLSHDLQDFLNSSIHTVGKLSQGANRALRAEGDSRQGFTTARSCSENIRLQQFVLVMKYLLYFTQTLV